MRLVFVDWGVNPNLTCTYSDWGNVYYMVVDELLNKFRACLIHRIGKVEE